MSRAVDGRTRVRHPSPLPFDEPVDARVARSRAAVLRVGHRPPRRGRTDAPSRSTPSSPAPAWPSRRSTATGQSRDDVLLAVIESCAPRSRSARPRRSTSRRALREIVHTMATFLNDPEWARMLPALHAAEDTTRPASRRSNDAPRARAGGWSSTTLLAPGRRRGRAAVRRSTDPEAMHAVRRPADVRPPHRARVKIDNDFVDRTVDNFLAAYRPA